MGMELCEFEEEFKNLWSKIIAAYNLYDIRG